MTDERIDLAYRERRGRPSLEIPAQKAIRGDADLERRLGGVLHDGDAVLFGEGEDAEDLAHAMGGTLRVNRAADGADRGPGGGRAAEEGERGWWGPRRPVAVVDAMVAARGAQVLAEELVRLRRSEERRVGKECRL